MSAFSRRSNSTMAKSARYQRQDAPVEHPGRVPGSTGQGGQVSVNSDRCSGATEKGHGKGLCPLFFGLKKMGSPCTHCIPLKILLDFLPEIIET